jgi:hypothetical protein
VTEPPGPGLDPDAVSYLGAAVSLVHGHGYRVPVTPWTASDTTGLLAHFPPGFSTAIAAPVAFGMSPIQSGRLIVAVSAFAAAVLLILLVGAAAGSAAAVIAFVGAAVTPALVNLHISILSEPLFLAMLLGMMMSCLARRPAATGALAAGAVMVRYAGVAVAAAAVVWFLWQPGSWRRRMREAVIVVGPSLVLLGLWVARSWRAPGGTSNIRALGLYGSLRGTIGEGLSTVCDWLAPGSGGTSWRGVAVTLTVLVIAAVGVGAWRAFRRAPVDGRAPLTVVLAGVIAVCYVGMLIASRVAADPNIPFDDRILAPVILLAEIGLVIGGAIWWRRTPVVWMRGAVVVAGVVWALASLRVVRGRVGDALRDGEDFASADWRFSPTVAWVRANAGTAATLYTNWPAAVYFYAARGSHELPRSLDPLTLRRFGERLVRQRGVLVGFTSPNPDGVSPDSIASRLRLRPLARLADGSVWAP